MKINNYLIFFAILFSTGNAIANVINVPGNFLIIQAAINASVNGDTVLVEQGIYYENINFRGKNIVLTSRFYLTQDTSFICSTIINGSQPVFADTASCIILNSGEDSTAIIQGFTITGGMGTKWFDQHGAGTFREGGGIITEFSSPIIRWNHIVNNLVLNSIGVASTGGGGMRCGDGHPHIYNNVIAHNQARYGGGIVINFCTNAEIKNNLIVNNSGGQSFGGGGLWATGSTTATVLIVENNTIANNHVTGIGNYGGKGGGIFVFSITLNTKNNIVWGNTQSSGNSIATFLGGILNATYSNIDFSFTGAGNINTNPLFVDTIIYLLSTVSPCIDGGDNASAYNDLTVSANTAQFPSQGSERNDIGAYGGPLAVIFPTCSLGSTGISELYNSDTFLVTPNPAYDFITINSNRNQIVHIKLFSSLGDEVLSKDISTNKPTPLFNLTEGIYYLKIISGNSVLSVKKIIFIK